MTEVRNIVAFHRRCKWEYLQLLEHFNLLFYGYGCKRKLLEELFSGGILLNCRFHGIREILQAILEHSSAPGYAELRKNVRRNTVETTMAKLGRLYQKDSRRETLILLNFDFKMLEPLLLVQHFRIVGTIEDTLCRFSFEDIRRFNFVFRDLTTFVPYTDELLDMDVSGAHEKGRSIMSVYENVPRKSQLAVLGLLRLRQKTKKVYLGDLFSFIKKKMLLRAKSECQTLLAEFLDHKLVKIRRTEEVALDLTEAEIRRFAESQKKLMLQTFPDV